MYVYIFVSVVSIMLCPISIDISTFFLFVLSVSSNNAVNTFFFCPTDISDLNLHYFVIFYLACVFDLMVFFPFRNMDYISL